MRYAPAERGGPGRQRAGHSRLPSNRTLVSCEVAVKPPGQRGAFLLLPSSPLLPHPHFDPSFLFAVCFLVVTVCIITFTTLQVRLEACFHAPVNLPAGFIPSSFFHDDNNE